MRTLRIRKFTLLCLLIILTLPWLFFVADRLIETKSLSFENNSAQDLVQQNHLNMVIQFIETNSNSWMDPNWQSQLQTQLRQADLDVTITSASRDVIFQSNPDPSRVMTFTEQFSVIQDGQVLGRIAVYIPNSKVFPMIAIIAGILLAFFIVGIEMRRFILKPLDKLSLVARQIAGGEFDVQLPKSRITEIAEVRDGFEVMMGGLQKSFQKQIELEEERRFVIAALAHDLRTPLFALRGYLDGLEQGIAQSPDKIAKYVAVCKEKSAQLDRLVEDLFTFTKTEYLGTNLNQGKVDLKLILQKSIDSLSPQAQQKHISMITNDSEDDCFIMGDSHLLERAMNNILDNAVRHTPPHGKIYVQCNKDHHKVTFMIQDSGQGFTSEELVRVFEPLYRGEASRNRSTGGVGLGLTISQRIIRQHGGSLAVGNHSNGGALLSGWIPAVDDQDRSE